MCPLLLLVSVAICQPPPEPLTPALPIPVRVVVAGLIESLGDADPDVRTNAAVSLAYIGADAVEALTTTVRSPNKDARAAAAYALGEIGGQAAPATEALVRALKDADKEVRRQSAAALGRIVAGARPQSGEPRLLAPPVPIDAPAPVFPPIK